MCSRWLFAPAAITVLAAGLQPACDNGVSPPSEKMVQDAVPAAESVQGLCLRDVVGDFVCGNELLVGWEDWLQIREDSSFTKYHYNSCADYWSEIGGTATIDGEYVVLHEPQTAALIGKKLVYSSHDRRLRVVRWGERTYLVLDAQVDYFCKLINDGVEPRRTGLGSVIYLRNGDEKLEAAGKPKPWLSKGGA
jgi:hypothetical protein